MWVGAPQRVWCWQRCASAWGCASGTKGTPAPADLRRRTSLLRGVCTKFTAACTVVATLGLLPLLAGLVASSRRCFTLGSRSLNAGGPWTATPKAILDHMSSPFGLTLTKWARTTGSCTAGAAARAGIDHARCSREAAPDCAGGGPCLEPAGRAVQLALHATARSLPSCCKHHSSQSLASGPFLPFLPPLQHQVSPAEVQVEEQQGGAGRAAARGSCTGRPAGRPRRLSGQPAGQPAGRRHARRQRRAGGPWPWGRCLPARHGARGLLEPR